MNYINFAAADAQYYALITFNDEYYADMGVDTNTCVLIDCIDDVTVNSNSELTRFPLVSGKITSDHAIIQPKTITLSGKFGSNASYSNRDRVTEKFGSIQRLFERIKNEAYFCTIQKVHKGNTFETFEELKNMVLTSITWTEKNNCLDFTFSFTEVFLVDVEVTDYEPDENSPYYTELLTTNINQLFYTPEKTSQIKEIANEIINEWEKNATDVAAASALGSTALSLLLSIPTGGSALIFGAASNAIALAAYEDAKGDAKEARKAVEDWATDPQKSKAIETAMQQIYSDFHIYNFSSDGDQICFLDNFGLKLKLSKNKAGESSAIAIDVYDIASGELIGQNSNIMVSSTANFENSKPIATIDDLGLYVLYKGKPTEYGFYIYSDDITEYSVVVTKIKPENYQHLIAERLAIALGID